GARVDPARQVAHSVVFVGGDDHVGSLGVHGPLIAVACLRATVVVAEHVQPLPPVAIGGVRDAGQLAIAVVTVALGRTVTAGSGARPPNAKAVAFPVIAAGRDGPTRIYGLNDVAAIIRRRC